MGETIRIEIPVSVNDNTDPGLSNITNKMNTLATAAQKVNRILSSGFKTRGIEQTAERVDRTPVSYTHLDVYKRQIMYLTREPLVSVHLTAG